MQSVCSCCACSRRLGPRHSQTQSRHRAPRCGARQDEVWVCVGPGRRGAGIERHWVQGNGRVQGWIGREVATDRPTASQMPSRPRPHTSHTQTALAFPRSFPFGPCLLPRSSTLLLHTFLFSDDLPPRTSRSHTLSRPRPAPSIHGFHAQNTRIVRLNRCDGGTTSLSDPPPSPFSPTANAAPVRLLARPRAVKDGDDGSGGARPWPLRRARRCARCCSWYSSHFVHACSKSLRSCVSSISGGGQWNAA